MGDVGGKFNPSSQNFGKMGKPFDRYKEMGEIDEPLSG
jgi:hypothetical protein